MDAEYRREHLRGGALMLLVLVLFVAAFAAFPNGAARAITTLLAVGFELLITVAYDEDAIFARIERRRWDAIHESYDRGPEDLL